MTTAIIGIGSMGGALARGFLASGMEPSTLILCNRTPSKLEPFKASGAVLTTDCHEAAQAADIILLGVGHDDIEGMVEEIASIDLTGKIIVSLGAGTGTDTIHEIIRIEGGTQPAVAVAIPNTAVAVCRSTTFIAYDNFDPVPEVEQLFERVGSVTTVFESELPVYTALASCGIAFAMRYIRAATVAGVELGVRASEAQRIVASTVAGAAALLSQDGVHAEAEIDKVTTAGGITIRGLNAMETAGFTGSVIAAHKACRK